MPSPSRCARQADVRVPVAERRMKYGNLPCRRHETRMGNLGPASSLGDRGGCRTPLELERVGARRCASRTRAFANPPGVRRNRRYVHQQEPAHQLDEGGGDFALCWNATSFGCDTALPAARAPSATTARTSPRHRSNDWMTTPRAIPTFHTGSNSRAWHRCRPTLQSMRTKKFAWRLAGPRRLSTWSRDRCETSCVV